MTILETIPILKQPNNYTNLLLYSGAGFSICILVSALLYLMDYNVASSCFAVSALFSAIIFIISIVLASTEPAIDTGKVKYIVRINDNYSLNKFCEKYKILEHTKYTDVYTVEELEND